MTDQEPPQAQQNRQSPADYPAAKARQGDIVLRRRWQRIVFIAGLAGCVLLVVIVGLLLGY